MPRPPTRDRLEHDRAGSQQRFRLGTRPRGFENRHTAFGRMLARPIFITKNIKYLRRWANKEQSGGGAGCGKSRIFTKKPPARMQRIGVHLYRRRQDCVSIEIGRWARPRQCDGLVGGAQIGRPEVVGSIKGDNVDVTLGGSACDAHRNLATIGDQQPLHSSPSFSSHPV